MKIRHADRRETIVLQMTPMIDIVFQLLVFFVFTFKIVLPEGDFNIRMPSAAASSSSQPSETPLLKVRLRAKDNGDIASIHMGDQPFNDFAELRASIRNLIGDAAGPGSTEQEVEIDADYDLKYRYTMNAITAISGEIRDGEKHKLVEKIRFAPVPEK